MADNKELIPITISWSSGLDTNRYTNIFPTPIILDINKKYGVAIESLDTYYSFPNVTYYNYNLKYTNNGNPVTLQIPIGCYDINTLNATIQTLLGADVGKITISTIDPQLKTSITIAANFTVDFTYLNSINSLLGFNSQVLTAGTHTSDNIANINRTNSIFVNCDLVARSYVNGSNQQVLYTFFPNVPPGYKIVQELNKLNFIRINKNQINSIQVWLTDQDGNPLDFRGEVVTIRLFIGEIN